MSRLLSARAWRADRLAAGQTPGARVVPVSARVGALFLRDASGEPLLHRERGGQPGPRPAGHGGALHQRRPARGRPQRHRVHPRLPGREGAVRHLDPGPAGGGEGLGQRRRSRPGRGLRRAQAVPRPQHPAGARRRHPDLRSRLPEPGPGHRLPGEPGPAHHLPELDDPRRAPPSCGSTATGSPAEPAAARGSPASARPREPAASSASSADTSRAATPRASPTAPTSATPSGSCTVRRPPDRYRAHRSALSPVLVVS